MKANLLLLAVAPAALMANPAVAQTAPVTAQASAPAAEPEKQAPAETFSTGVAKGRDRLDSATSTSSLRPSDIQEIGAHSLAEILRDIPGIRADPSFGEGSGNITVRGLPLASTGSKFMQLQEDGLPVMEFGDLHSLSSDMFMRSDFNLAQIEALRGGSASTFASNSPGGVINLISKTGDTTGGAVQYTEGLNYGEHRADFDYGGKLSDTVHYHIGGFYRDGEGPRKLGYDAYHGGQLKLNITKQFNTGFIRLYAKLLDDHTPFYSPAPLAVSGTNAAPIYANVPDFNVKTDSFMSRNITNMVYLNQTNRVESVNTQNGSQANEKSVGLEAQFELGGWTISDKFRFAARWGNTLGNEILGVVPATALAGEAGPGARLTYATGPNTGMVIANPATLNGNGLATENALYNFKGNNLGNVTNDFRATRVWNAGGGLLTMTAGFYKSRQTVDMSWGLETVLSDVAGGGNTALLNLATANGIAITQNGVIAYGMPAPHGIYHRRYDVHYDINAPYASLNYHIGNLAIGGSLRYDAGNVRGAVYGAELGGGKIGNVPYDINGDGVISLAEMTVSVLPLTDPNPVNYDYHYLSYSAGVNYRVSSSLAVFGRYSRGARAGADAILFSSFLSPNGGLTDPKDAYDPVRQAEIGVKYRAGPVTLNLTGFSANAGDFNAQVNTGPDGLPQLQEVVRTYSAKGAEFEGALHQGHFSLSVGATYTKAKITGDLYDPAGIGNTPRAQPKMIFEATPQFTTALFTLGTNIIGTTGSYAQDTDQLKMPGYTFVNAFLEIRPAKRVHVSVNVNNLFNTLGITGVTQSALPASGLVTANTILGRTVFTSFRFDL